MTNQDVTRFSKRLRRLEVTTFAQLVADLWTARGKQTTRDGATISVQSGQTTHRLVVVHTTPPVEPDALVVTSRLSDDPDVVDAAEILRVARYAVERDRSAAILERYLGDGAATFCYPATDSPKSTQSEWVRSIPQNQVRVVIAAVLLLISSWAIVSSVNMIPGMTTSPADAASQGAVPAGKAASNESQPTDYDTLGAVNYSAIGCPPPPADVSPGSLRPDVVPGASAMGLDGWRLINGSSQSQGDDVDRIVSFNPVAHHTATYVPPSGERLTLQISLWQSERSAATATSAFASANTPVVRWGQYTLIVRAVSADGGSLSESQTVERARPLLSEVRGTTGSRLGFRCVEGLLAESESETESTVRE